MTTIKQILKSPNIDQELTISGWVRTRRGSKNVSFIALNDGSTIRNLQIVAESTVFNEEIIKKINTGACIRAKGLLKSSEGKEQSLEVLAKEITILGESDATEYPLQPKKHSLEFLREKAHLRFRTNTFSAVFRVRHALTFAIHDFFNKNGYVNIHTPIITGADAEGAGEMFKVSNFDFDAIPLNNGKVDFSEDFFGKATNLTVSGPVSYTHLRAHETS